MPTDQLIWTIRGLGHDMTLSMQMITANGLSLCGAFRFYEAFDTEDRSCAVKVQVSFFEIF